MNKTAISAASGILVLGFACQSIGTGAKRGETIYRNACLPCHGKKGDGAGTMSGYMLTKPRDFRTGVYKFRSTPSGSMPTAHDLTRTITAGVQGTSMPPFTAMRREDALAVASYITWMSRDAARQELQAAVAAGDLEAGELENALNERMQPGNPLVIPPEPPADQASIARGEAIYERMECAKCHGISGRGDGPAAKDLKDDWGNATVPADFTLSGGVKGGESPMDIYRTFMTGMDGTSMPSYVGQLTPAEAWDLTHYVLALRR